MGQFFLKKTQIDLSECIRIGDEPVLEKHDQLRAGIEAKVGPEAANLFAEPLLSRGNDTAEASVSWYTDYEGTGQKLSQFDPAQRSDIEAKLTERLAPLSRLLTDPELGAIASAALYQSHNDELYVVDGEPVILNWGMKPADVQSEAQRLAHYASGLGRFMPLTAAPPLSAAEAQAMPAPVAVASGTTAAVAATTTAANSPTSHDIGEAVETRERSRVPLVSWLPLVFLLLLATGTLIWLLLPGNRIFPNNTAQVIDNATAQSAIRDANNGLRDRIRDLESALDQAVCRDDGILILPDGYTIEGLLPPLPGDSTSAPSTLPQLGKPDPILPPNPQDVRVEPAAGAGSTELADLLEHLEERTALVIAPTQGGLSVGTGFFISPDLVITNYHVIESASPDQLYVTNNALGEVSQVEILKVDGPFEQTGGDLALLRVPGAAQIPYAIRVGNDTLRLQPVVAAGYPGDLLDTDAQFQRLTAGDTTAVPQLAVTNGTVSSEQNMGGTKVVVHSAPISTGNSGGPLVDMCGNVVGINTFVRKGQLRNLNFALSSDKLMQFLQGTSVQPQTVSGVCAPQVVPNSGAGQAQAANAK
ncbi:MAG: trypsin-like peptidase domain-containing protein [Pseudomonadota bacterium]